MLTKTQVARLLALDIGWRRRLAAMPGPGWWARPKGWADGSELTRVQESPCELFASDDLSARGWAWAPCDSLSWLRATGAGVWLVQLKTTCIDRYSARDGGWEIVKSDPIDAALSYMEANDPPEVKNG